jgi:hypothetical protein
MNIGDCPYDDCQGTLAIDTPDRTPAYALVQCDHCGRDIWYRFSRVDPKAWTLEQFEAEHVVDEVTMTIVPRVPYSSTRAATEAGIGKSLSGRIEKDFPEGFIDPTQ